MCYFCVSELCMQSNVCFWHMWVWLYVRIHVNAFRRKDDEFEYKWPCIWVQVCVCVRGGGRRGQKGNDSLQLDQPELCSRQSWSSCDLGSPKSWDCPVQGSMQSEVGGPLWKMVHDGFKHWPHFKPDNLWCLSALKSEAQNTYDWASILFNALNSLLCVVLATITRYHYYSPFTDEDTEA